MGGYYHIRARVRVRRARGRMFAGAAIAAGLMMVARGHTSSPPVTASTSAAGGSNEALANSMAASGYGWIGSETTCLDQLWTRENAAWDPTQWNLGGSGAYGIPQSLPASKMAAAGADWLTNAATQIRWGLGYIHDTYGTPCGAWGHETSAGWY